MPNHPSLGLALHVTFHVTCDDSGCQKLSSTDQDDPDGDRKSDNRKLFPWKDMGISGGKCRLMSKVVGGGEKLDAAAFVKRGL